MSRDPATLLREHGLRVTAQRLAILRAVAAEPHATADALAESVRAEVGSISLQAVYDSLAALISAGLIRRIQPAGSPALFEARVGDNHHHAVCRSCGRVTDVDCALGAAPCLTPEGASGFQVDTAEVIYWGICLECARLAQPTTEPASPSRQPATKR